MGIDCSCTIGWASSREFADELGASGLLTVDEFGEPPIDPFCEIHGSPVGDVPGEPKEAGDG